jgi:hypothetical protein
MSHESKMCDRFHASYRSYAFHVSYGTCMLLTLTPILLAGCGIGSARKKPLEVRAEKLQQETTDLTGKLEQCETRNARLQQQVKNLQALPPGREDPYKLTGIKISGYTGFYDKDDDGKREKLVVYLEPIDEDGDIMKAAGTVSVELWNLNGPGDQALLGRWEVPPSELRKHWLAALISSYRLSFDAPVTPELLAQPLTVRVTFTDYCTGETFHRQHVIQPQSQ